MLAGGSGNQGGNGNRIGAHMEFQNSDLVTVDIIIGILNICLLLVLLYMYLRSYRDFKSKFTFGLVAFALLLLLQNVLFTAFLLTYQGFRGPGMGIKYNRIFRPFSINCCYSGISW
jgi:hypothetical protein